MLLSPNDPSIKAAIVELQGMIGARFPTASFSVGHGHDPEGIHLTAVVDIDDPDDVVDLVIDRLLEMQIAERLPVYVIPVRAPARIAALAESGFQARRTATAAIP